MLIVHNARIHTMDPGMPLISALVIDRGEIISGGHDQQILAEYGVSKGAKSNDRIQVLDLAGRVVLPGLIDAHIHLEQYALGLTKIDCETNTREACLQRVADRARSTPRGEWILGHGWNQNDWAGGFGTIDELDTVAPNHPVYLTAKSLHAGWANSAAMLEANISLSTPDPADGRIGRTEDGHPNGILYESAMGMVEKVVPVPSIERVSEAILEAQTVLWKMGITGVHDFDRQRCFAALQRLHSTDQLRLRVIKSIPLDHLHHAVAIGLRSGFGDDLLRIGSIKAFADGALGPRTAAMLQAYEHEPGNLGMLFIDAEELYERGRLAVENGLSLAVHAIGDRANHEVLNAFEHLRQYEKDLHKSENRPLRHRIEHVQLIHPEDAGRLAELQVIASMQPIHGPSDMYAADRYWGERAAFSYAWRTQLEHGASLAFGSDAPVESPNPFWGIHAAVTRQREDGSPQIDGWIPQQRISLFEAIAGYTTGAAFAAQMENRQGKLSRGFLADLIILNEDPFTCQPSELRQLSPVATMVAGEWVYLDENRFQLIP